MGHPVLSRSHFDSLPSRYYCQCRACFPYASLIYSKFQCCHMLWNRHPKSSNCPTFPRLKVQDWFCDGFSQVTHVSPRQPWISVPLPLQGIPLVKLLVRVTIPSLSHVVEQELQVPHADHIPSTDQNVYEYYLMIVSCCSAHTAYPDNFVYLLNCQYMAPHHYNFLSDFVFQYHRMLSMYSKIPRPPMFLQLRINMFVMSAGSIAWSYEHSWGRSLCYWSGSKIKITALIMIFSYCKFRSK